MMEIHCDMYRNVHGRNFFCVTPTNIFGPFDNFILSEAHVIPSLIHKAYITSRNGETTLSVRGSGIAKRQFIFSLDLGKYILLLAQRIWDAKTRWWLDNNVSHIIISPTREYTIGEVAEAIAKRFDLTVQYDTSFSDGQLRKFVSNDLLKKCLDMETEEEDQWFTPFFSALNQTMDWFIVEYECETTRK
jgi:GDP-L-fucose synthase